MVVFDDSFLSARVGQPAVVNQKWLPEHRVEVRQGIEVAVQVDASDTA
jgi:hypothetical protein